MIYEIKSHFPGSLFTSVHTGKKWIVPNWIEVPFDTKFEDIKWIPIEMEKTIELAKVKASRGNTVYTLTKYKNDYKCTCSGFKFKKGCKHIANYILENKILK